MSTTFQWTLHWAPLNHGPFDENAWTLLETRESDLTQEPVNKSQAELLENHEAPPNTVLRLYRPVVSQYYYISAQPGFYRQPVLLGAYESYQRGSNRKDWIHLLRKYSGEDLDLYGLFVEGAEQRQARLRRHVVGLFEAHTKRVADALEYDRSTYVDLCTALRRWPEDAERFPSFALKGGTLRPPGRDTTGAALQQLASIYRYLNSWQRVGVSKGAVWPDGRQSVPSRDGYAVEDFEKILLAPIEPVFWGVDENQWLPLLGV